MKGTRIFYNLAPVILLLAAGCSAQPAVERSTPARPTAAVSSTQVAAAENIPTLVPSLTTAPSQENTPAAESPADPQPALTNSSTDLVDRQPESLAIPAAGLSMDAYRLKQPLIGVAYELGYPEVMQTLQTQSKVSRLPQGEYLWRTAELTRMAAANRALAPFGFRLTYAIVARDDPYQMELFHGEERLLDAIIGFGRVSTNRSATDFFLMLETAKGQSRYFLLRAGGLETWPSQYVFLDIDQPQYLGDETLRCEIRSTLLPTPANAQTPQPMPEEYVHVFRDEQSIDEIQAPFRAGSPGYIGCWTYEEHWVVEVLDNIVIDGQPVNDRFGYSKSFEFHLLNGKPVFFYEKDNALGLSYDGQEISLPWQSISHYGCCSASMYNPIQFGSLLTFFAWQGEQGFYVELEGNT